VCVYAVDIAKGFSDWFHLKNLRLLQQWKYQTAFKSLLVTVFCKCCIFRSYSHKGDHSSSMDKIVFRIFMTGFQDFILQRYTVQNMQLLQKSFFQILKMFMEWYTLHFVIQICYDNTLYSICEAEMWCGIFLISESTQICFVSALDVLTNRLCLSALNVWI